MELRIFLFFIFVWRNNIFIFVIWEIVFVYILPLKGIKMKALCYVNTKYLFILLLHALVHSNR